MQLSEQQIAQFRAINRDTHENVPDDEMRSIAQGVANYYLILLKILQRTNKNAHGPYK